MRNHLLIALFCLVGNIYGQDQLFKKDNSKINVKVLEISETEIKYKQFNYLDGPTYIVAKKDVAMIIYQNGSHEVFNNKAEVAVLNKDNSTETQKKFEEVQLAKFNDLVSTKNLVSLNILEPMNGTFSLNYLREIANNLFHVYIPIGVGFTQPYYSQMMVPANYSFGGSNTSNYVNNYKFIRKSIEAGIGLHFQTSGKRAVTHFIGPYVGISQFNGTYNVTNFHYDPYTNINQHASYETAFVLNRYQILLDNGFLFRATKNFNIILIAGIGYRVDDYIANNPSKYTGNSINYNYYSLPLNSFKLGLSMGYRF